MPDNSYLVCAFVQPQPKTIKFRRVDWPLHVTIVPWFKPNITEVEFGNLVQAAIKNQPSFIATAGSTVKNRGGRQKSLLDRNQWQVLHELVLDAVDESAKLLVPRTSLGSNYKPHITFQKAGHLKEGDKFVCNSLYLIRLNDGVRTVVSRLKLRQDEPTAD